MSFILDALRKSEHARQHLGGATLAELPLGRRHRSHPWWVIALAALLIVNVVVLLLVLLRKPVAAETASIPAPVARETVRVVAPPPAATARTPLAQEVAQPPVAQYETIPRSESPLDIVPPGPTLVRAIEAPPAQPAATPVSNVSGVGPLHLDMLVYSKNQSERFAYINKHKYTEGQTMSEGPHVAEITQDGVILLYQGQRMELTRQQ